jgi:hypothetical protein
VADYNHRYVGGMGALQPRRRGSETAFVLR